MNIKLKFAALVRPVQQEFALNLLAQIPWVAGEVLRNHWIDIAFNGLMTAVVFTCLNWLTIRQMRRMMNERHAFLAQQMGVMVAEHMQRDNGRIEAVHDRINTLREDIDSIKIRQFKGIEDAIDFALDGSSVHQRQNTLDKEMAVLCSEHERYTKRAKSIEERHHILERNMIESQQLAREANREAARCAGALAQMNDLLAKQERARKRSKNTKD